MRISDCGLRIEEREGVVGNPKSEIRNPKLFAVRLPVLRLLPPAFCLLVGCEFAPSVSPQGHPRHPPAAEATCVKCHLEMEADPAVDIPPSVEDWRASVHGLKDVVCFRCHGGDPWEPTEEAMSGARSFIGAPLPEYIPGLCGRCHAGPLREVRAGVHPGMKERPEAGGKCTDCHGYHRITKR